MAIRHARLLAIAIASCSGPLLGAGEARALPVIGATAMRADVQGAAPLPRRAMLGDALAPATRLRITVALRPRIGLAAYAAAVSDPRLPDYRHFLGVAQFRERFGARAAAVAAVRTTLSRAGLRVGAVTANGLAIAAAGSAARMQRTFHTRLDRVRLAGGRRAYADVVPPTLPSGVAAVVQGVAGLDSLPLLRPAGLVRARSRTHAGAPLLPSVVSGPSTCTRAAAVANTAQDIASAYGLNSLWDAGDIGSGATVALYELEPFSQSDVTAYDSCYGVSPSVTVTRVAGGAGTGAGTGEAALDVEDVAGLAPGASIDVYEGPNNGEGPLAVDETIVSADTARIVSTSWGACEAANGAGFAEEENTLFEEAATQGQTVFAAAGDSGSDDCGTSGPSPAVDDPASQPDVTGVGGTSLAGTYAQPADETVWNDARGAGGGGMSSLWASPSYQSGLGASMREVPDVSADADPATGYAIDYKSRWLDFGGTSAAAPTWAALTALAERSSACASDTSGLGLINDALYTLPESDFDDVTSGNNGYGGVPGYPAGPGYDMASGLGAPNGSALVPALCAKGAGAAVDDPTATATVTATSTTTTTTTTATTGTAPPTGPGAPPTTTVTPPAPNPPGSTTTGAGPRHPAPAIVDFSAPARLRVTVGVRVRERLHAADRDGLRLTYSAVRLPPGLRISRATGVVSGRPRRAGTYTASVRAVDARGDGRSVVIRWVVRRAARARRR